METEQGFHSSRGSFLHNASIEASQFSIRIKFSLFLITLLGVFVKILQHIDLDMKLMLAIIDTVIIIYIYILVLPT